LPLKRSRLNKNDAEMRQAREIILPLEENGCVRGQIVTFTLRTITKIST
jgi:hypothetical protein